MRTGMIVEKKQQLKSNYNAFMPLAPLEKEKHVFWHPSVGQYVDQV